MSDTFTLLAMIAGWIVLFCYIGIPSKEGGPMIAIRDKPKWVYYTTDQISWKIAIDLFKVDPDSVSKEIITAMKSIAGGKDLPEVERLRGLRNELASLYDENEPHDMGGPHISLMYVVEKMDEALEAGDKEVQ